MTRSFIIHPIIITTLGITAACSGDSFNAKEDEPLGGGYEQASDDEQPADSNATLATYPPPPKRPSSNVPKGDGSPEQEEEEQEEPEPISCDPLNAPNTVDSSCGIFVSSSRGNDLSGNGSKAKPVESIAKALAIAAGQPVYLCAEEFSQNGTWEISTNVQLHGGLDCTTDWHYIGNAAKTRVVGDPNVPVARFTPSASGSIVNDLEFSAPDATDAGASSIAVIVSQASIVFARSKLLAGQGADGTDGAPIGPPAASGSSGTNTLVGHGYGATNAGRTICSDGQYTSGGAGGSADYTNGKAGVAAPGGALGGVGSLAEQTLVCEKWTSTSLASTPHGNGRKGSPGGNGAAGSHGTGIGFISVAGYEGAAGNAGKAGSHGTGGGGGGALRGQFNVFTQKEILSPSRGGGGGAGGCGGSGGNAGEAGGSSIALVSLNATVQLIDSVLVAASAGDGGNGTLGQPGGNGGAAGPAATNASGAHSCAGGSGGNGGSGGHGGAGSGGHSLGIAFIGAAPIRNNVALSIGMPGNGGSVESDTASDGEATDQLGFN